MDLGIGKLLQNIIDSVRGYFSWLWGKLISAINAVFNWIWDTIVYCTECIFWFFLDEKEGIIWWFVEKMFDLAEWAVDQFPNLGDTLGEYQGVFADAMNIISKLNDFAPVKESVTLLGLFLVFIVLFLGFKLFLKLIPGIG